MDLEIDAQVQWTNSFRFFWRWRRLFDLKHFLSTAVHSFSHSSLRRLLCLGIQTVLSQCLKKSFCDTKLKFGVNNLFVSIQDLDPYLHERLQPMETVDSKCFSFRFLSRRKRVNGTKLLFCVGSAETAFARQNLRGECVTRTFARESACKSSCSVTGACPQE